MTLVNERFRPLSYISIQIFMWSWFLGPFPHIWMVSEFQSKINNYMKSNYFYLIIVILIIN